MRMTFADIAEMATESEPDSGAYFSEWFFGPLQADDLLYIDLPEDSRLTFCQVFFYPFDSRRYIAISVALFDDEPFAMKAEAGREGRDDSYIRVFNSDIWRIASNYFMGLVLSSETDLLTGINDKVPGIYGRKIVLDLDNEGWSLEEG